LAVIGAVLLLGSSAAWAQIIDPFSTTAQSVISTAGTPGTYFLEIAAPEAIGGVRYIEATHVSGPLSVSTVVSLTAPGTVSFSSDSGTTGWGRVVWDGLDDDSPASALLGGVDLTASGGTTILLRATADLGATLWLTLFDGSASATSSVAVPAATILFTDFFIALASFAGVDLTSIDRIELAIAGAGGPTSALGANTDVSVDLVGVVSPIPEPATISLFGLGLATLAGLARRRRARTSSIPD
jgi:hypothetical protein